MDWPRPQKKLEVALTDRHNMSLGTYSCKGPGKSPELVVAPEGPVRSQRSVLHISQRSSYLEIDLIREFLDCQEAYLTLLESVKGGEQELTSTRKWNLEEAARTSAEKAKPQEVTIKTINATSAATTEEDLVEVQCVASGDVPTMRWARIIGNKVPPAALRSCCADPGGFAKMKGIRIIDLIYLNVYVPFCVKNIHGTLTPCSTWHFAVIIKGNRETPHIRHRGPSNPEHRVGTW